MRRPKTKSTPNARSAAELATTNAAAAPDARGPMSYAKDNADAANAWDADIVRFLRPHIRNQSTITPARYERLLIELGLTWSERAKDNRADPRAAASELLRRELVLMAALKTRRKRLIRA